MKNNETLFTIGQFAALHGVNKKTLMWYDEVDLFKPAVVKENGYRYYSYYQSTVLETILMLRKLDVSIQEIKRFLQNRSSESLGMLLKEKITELDSHISRLKSIRQVLSQRDKENTFLQTIHLTQISVIEKERQLLATVAIQKNLPLEKEIEMMITEAKKQNVAFLHDTSYGSMIPVDNLLKGNFDNYSHMYMIIHNAKCKKTLHKRPAGPYLRAFYKGRWEGLPKKYIEILEYARQHGLVLGDYAYEMGINEMVIHSIEDYITQIEIPILGVNH